MVFRHVVTGVSVSGLLLMTPGLTLGQSATSTQAAPGALQSDRSPAQTPRPVAAVLPFSNVSGQPADGWLGDGIAATILGDLERGGQVSVVGPGTLLAEAIKQGALLPEGDARVAIEIGRRLGVSWLVRGGFQRVGDQVRITARVVNVQTGNVARTAKVDGAVSQIFALQDRIVRELGADLQGGTATAGSR